MGSVTSAPSSPTWLGVFASRLLQTRPKTSGLPPPNSAVSSIERARGLDSRAAAQSYAAERYLAKAKQALFEQESPSSRYRAMFRDSVHDLWAGR
jgi:hypothetical protein